MKSLFIYLKNGKGRLLLIYPCTSHSWLLGSWFLAWGASSSGHVSLAANGTRLGFTGALCAVHCFHCSENSQRGWRWVSRHHPNVRHSNLLWWGLFSSQHFPPHIFSLEGLSDTKLLVNRSSSPKLIIRSGNGDLSLVASFTFKSWSED